MYRYLEHRLAERVLECLQKRYPGAALPPVVMEPPPQVELGDFAIPMFPFAKPLRSAPLKIAEAIRAEIGPIEGIAEMLVAPPGYLNIRIDRSWLATALAADQKAPADVPPGKILVEHSSINPNKAAHIGHLRNAILGDTFVRLLRFAGREVDVQNYIDNTGVQVADVVVGFTHLEKKSHTEIEALTRQPRFDYYCWDLYARVSQWYEIDKQNLQVRLQTLHAIEDGTDHEFCGVDVCDDDGAERTISVNALAPHPLRKSRIAIEDVIGGDVVDAGVAEDEVVGLPGGDGVANLANDNAELALIGRLAVIGRGPPDHRARRCNAGRGLEEIQRFLRHRLIELGGECVEVIPERNDLARHGRCQQLDVMQRQHVSVRSRVGEHVAVMNADARRRQRPEAGAAILTEADPARHAKAGAGVFASAGRAALS